MIKIKQHSFNFPLNVTHEISIDNIEDFKKNNFSNRNIYIKLKLDKLLKKNFNQTSLEEEIKNATNAEKVKVSFVYDTDTNIRSKEVTDKDDVIDKFKSYAEINGIKYDDTLIDKLSDIKDNLLLNTFTPHDSFVLEYLDLRGSIGIMDGQGKEEISIDFTQYEDGVIALTGENGKGKTTIIENCHPYPCMLTRQGTLKEHFCLNDSHRILVYRTSSGKRLRITFHISGTSKSTLTRYYVEEQEPGKDWEPIRSITGDSASYNEWVNNTFGPKELFLRTAFYAKEQVKGLPDLSQATKSEKMTLFSTLAGTDYLSVFSDQAKLLIKQEEKKIDDAKGELKDFDNIEVRQSENEELIKTNEAKITEYKDFIVKDSEELIKYNTLQKDFIKCEATFDIYRKEYNQKRQDKEEAERNIKMVENNIIGIHQQLEDKDLYQEQLKWYEDNMAKRKTLVSDENKLREKFNSAQFELDKKEVEYNKKKDRLNSLNSEIKLHNVSIENWKKAVPDLDGKCPVCGAPLSEHKKEELLKEKEYCLNKIKEYETENEQYSIEVNELSDWLDKNSLQNFKTTLTDLSKKITEISNDISQIDSYADTLNIDEIKDVLNNSEAMLEKEESEKTSLENKINTLSAELIELDKKLNDIPEDYSDKIQRLERGLEDSRQSIATLTAEITMAHKELDRIAGFETKVKEIKSAIKVYQKNIKEYEIIQTAFGNNGIQALELDSAAPEISNIANVILADNYGDRFTISFDTQRDTKDGRRIDDFIINVFDAKSGRNKKLDFLCSGESIWIKQALYFAFSVIRARRTGFCFKTRFLDESDGSLDSEARVKYLNMVESAHKQCGANQTVLITHSQELKDIIEQKIEL